jgi:hypothetical protein
MPRYTTAAGEYPDRISVKPHPADRPQHKEPKSEASGELYDLLEWLVEEPQAGARRCSFCGAVITVNGYCSHSAECVDRAAHDPMCGDSGARAEKTVPMEMLAKTW